MGFGRQLLSIALAVGAFALVFAVPKVDEATAAARSLSGSWVMLQSTTTVSQVPVVGKIYSTTRAVTLHKLTHSTDRLRGGGRVCDVQVDSGSPFVTTTIPKALMRALPAPHIDARIGKRKGKLTLSQKRQTVVVGARLKHPTRDALPTTLDDRRLHDLDAGVGRGPRCAAIDGRLLGGNDALCRHNARYCVAGCRNTFAGGFAMSENPDKSETIDEAPPRNASGAMIPFALSGMVLMAAAVAAVWMWRHEVPAPVRRSTVSLPPEMAPKLEDFELTERSGRTFHPRDLRGQVWVVSFFFSTCIGPCQRLNSNIAAMQQDPDLADVRWVSITVDPDNDTIEVLQRYADRFHANPDRWLFCRNTMEYTEQLGHDVIESVGLHLLRHVRLQRLQPGDDPLIENILSAMQALVRRPLIDLRIGFQERKRVVPGQQRTTGHVPHTTVSKTLLLAAHQP